MQIYRGKVCNIFMVDVSFSSLVFSLNHISPQNDTILAALGIQKYHGGYNKNQERSQNRYYNSTSMKWYGFSCVNHGFFYIMLHGIIQKATTCFQSTGNNYDAG